MAEFTAREVMLLMELATSSSDSDDEVTCVLPDKIKKNRSKSFLETIHQFSEEEFRSHFRLKLQTANAIIRRYKESQFYPSDATHGGTPPLSAEEDFFTFLWFAGNKVSLRDVSLRFGIGCSTAFYQIKRVMDFLIHIAPTIIRFPDDKEQAAADLYNIAGFPDTLGCIDGTSIRIRTPAHKIKSTYVNRHDIPSITLQAVCDAKKKFIDISVGAPAKIHDARVFELSDLSSELPEICGRKYHLLRDSAYPIREWLLVPYRNYGTLSNGQKFYNKRFCATRVLIENSFGLLKGRFRQLLEIEMHRVDKVCKFVTSCCVLHNLCIEYDDNFICCDDQFAENDEFNEDDETQQHLKRLGEQKRDALMRRLYVDEE